MTADLRSTLDVELDSLAPPSPLSGVAIAALGRRRLRRRRLGGVLGAVAGIAVVSVLAAYALGAGTSVPTADGPPGVELPSIDPDMFYEWVPTASAQSQETVPIADALWDALSAIEGLSVRVEGPDGATPVQSRADFPELTRSEFGLVETSPDGVAKATGHVEPVYETAGSIELLRDGVPLMRLKVQMFPAGGYLTVAPPGMEPQPGRNTTGVPVPYVSPNCAFAGITYLHQAVHYISCDEQALPGGESAVAADAMVEGIDGPDFRVVNAVRYLANGDAAVITLVSDGDAPYGELVYGDSREVVLSPDRLTAIIASLPAIPVV